jgi:hypothetical protein
MIALGRLYHELILVLLFSVFLCMFGAGEIFMLFRWIIGLDRIVIIGRARKLCSCILIL